MEEMKIFLVIVILCSSFQSSFTNLYLASDCHLSYGYDDCSSPPNDNEQVPHGTICTKDTNLIVCQNGEWKLTVSEYDNKQHRSKRGFFSKVVRALFGRRRSPRDNTPPRLRCPPNINADADISKDSTRVTWSEPSAYDNKDGTVRADRIGPGPGTEFIGKTSIRYYARDRSGNMAKCSFTITVKVTRCRGVPPAPNRIRLCSHSDWRYGMTCHFECYMGYKLVGHDTTTCMKSGTWSATFPKCEVVKCPALPPPTKQLKYSCYPGRTYKSVCMFKCIPGFDIPSGKSRVIICRENGKWQGDIPTCIDVQKPKIENCKRYVYDTTSRNSTRGTIYWKTPTVSDNHDNNITLVKKGDVSPGDKIEAGIYRVSYYATDSAGNSATPCHMYVIMKVLLCPRIHHTYGLTVTCPWGNRYGAECNFTCEPGSQLKGPELATCEKSSSELYSYWNWGDRQPYCKVVRKCVTNPNIPKNGALVCDYWLGGKFCQMQCKKGFDVRPGYPFYTMLVCGDSGQWLPANALPLPDCSKTRAVKGGKFRMWSAYYFEGDCKDEDVQRQIKKNYIEALSNSEYMVACIVHKSKCNIENVQVLCGSKRRKRAVELKIMSEIVIDVEDAENTPPLTDIQTQIMSVFKNETENGALGIDLPGNSTLIPLDVAADDVVFMCPNNTFPSYTTSSCVECAAGTFYDGNSQSCPQCPKGQYQPLEGQPSCTSCPEKTTTDQKGSHTLDECQDACSPGFWSPNGIVPCSPCLQGSYTGVYGSMKCTTCPGSTSTLNQGSTQVTDCKYFDLVLPNSNSTASMTVGTVQGREVILSVWIRFPIETDVPVAKITFIQDNSEERVIILSRLSNTTFEGVHVSVPETEWTFITTNISLPENYNDSLSDGNETILVTVKGPIILSQLNIWSTNHTFSDIQQTANKCMSDRAGDILQWKSWESADTEGTLVQIPSRCDDIDECRDHPCGDGKCTNELGGFTCDCYPGFQGRTCQENIDECQDNMCQNNSTCIDGINQYTCACPSNFNGTYCDILVVDGKWGKWSPWTPCSVSCNNGTRTRQRDCDDPPPYNGGKMCTGMAVAHDLCQVIECPVCKVLHAPYNGSVECNGTEEDGFRCTLACNEGYAFDHEIKPLYECGPSTFYLWDFKTDDNPNGDLPTCSPTKDSSEMSAMYIALYDHLYCTSEKDSTEIQSIITSGVQNNLQNIPCLTDGKCDASDIIIINCNSNQKRRKRAIKDTSNPVGFQMTFSCVAVNMGSDACAATLVDAINSMQDMAEKQVFHVDYDTSTYKLDLNKTDAQGQVKCEIGFVQSGIYCVPCGIGRYYVDGSCEKCDVGFYQDTVGHIFCLKCPEGTSTEGRGSRSVDSCSVKRVKEDGETGLTHVTAVSIGVCVCLLFFCVIGFLAIRSRKLVFRSGDVSTKERKEEAEEEGKGVLLCKMRRLDEQNLQND